MTQVTASSPLWCQGSSTTDSIFWRLPDGAVLGANSSPASGAQVVTAPGQLGLTPTGSNLPSGVYTCIVNGMESFLQLIHTSGGNLSALYHYSNVYYRVWSNYTKWKSKVQCW